MHLEIGEHLYINTMRSSVNNYLRIVGNKIGNGTSFSVCDFIGVRDLKMFNRNKLKVSLIEKNHESNLESGFEFPTNQ